MKKVMYVRALLALLLIGAWLAAPAAAQAQDKPAKNERVLDEIVAVVGKDIILRSDVDGLVHNFVQQSRTSYSQELWNEALNELINQKVLAEHARRDTTIEVTDDQVDQMLDQRIQQMAAQMGGKARLEEAYGLSLLQIKTELRDDFREQLMAEQFQSRRMQKIRVTPSEVEAFFKEIPTDSLPVLPEMVRVAHIVRYPEASEAARAEAREIVSAIRDSIVTGGAAFEDMARRFSDDPGSAPYGGRLENYNLSDLVPEFAAVAARIQVDSVSQVFETPFGYHIMRVNSRSGDVVDFNHILIRVDEQAADPTEAIAYLETVRDSLVEQEIPFAVMARRHSQEERSAVQGGRVVDPRTGERDLVLRQLGPTWTETIRRLKVGEISQPAPVELLDGKRAYHIVLLQRHEPEHRVSLAKDYSRIQQIALRRKQERVMREWMNHLRQDVYIDVRV